MHYVNPTLIELSYTWNNQLRVMIVVMIKENKVGEFLLESDIGTFGDIGIICIPWTCNPYA